MKKTKRRLETKSVAQAIPAVKPRHWWSEWWIWATALAGLLIVYQVYAPALNGPFVFDDHSLPFRSPEIKQDMLSFVGRLRPLLMLSFWIDYHRAAGVDGADPHAFHSTNIFLHFLTSVLATLIALKLLEWTDVDRIRRAALAIFAGTLFLLHPLQTESVAYVASRSEVLSVLFYYAAFAVFIYSNRDRMTWLRAISVVVLFGAAAATKEHTLTLPALILLTDFFWRRGGWRKNGVLYGLLAAVCVAGAVVVWKLLLG